MTVLRSLEGMLEGELTSAVPGEALKAINDAGLQLYAVEWRDDLTVRFQFRRQDRKVLESICRKRGDGLKILHRRGLFWSLRGLLGRPVLIIGILSLLGLTLFLPTRVLFISVDGNVTIPARQILSAAEDCGIRFGASRRAVRSEKMKNVLLGALPELKWAGINTSGCTAVISVREREAGEQEAQTTAPRIIADRDGYITEATVTKGSALCAPGQVVKKGQLLISGYTDCGICIRYTGAEGEVYAETGRKIQSVTPSERTKRVEEGALTRRYSLILGKKRINLWKDSGIWDTSCGRMYEEYYITLPGGVRLPIALAVDTVTAWETQPGVVTAEEAEAALSEFAKGYCLGQMTAGQILRAEHQLTGEEGLYRLDSTFLCTEMIGRETMEQIGDTNGKTD